MIQPGGSRVIYESAEITVRKGNHGHLPQPRLDPSHGNLAGAFESGSIESGESATVRLDEAGSFAYYCAFHPFMKGTIVVE
jgi:plastocyanin